MEINITTRDKQKITKYKKLFALITRAFYTDKEIVVMDAFLYIYFQQFILETDQLTKHTSLPEEHVRKALYKLQQANIIKMVATRQIYNEKNYLLDIIQKRWEEDAISKCEFWELNENIRQVLYNRLRTIEKKIEADFKNFDFYTKKCTNRYCSKEFRTEEYFNLNNKCSTCNSLLELKYKMDLNSRQKIEDKDAALELINFFFNYLEELADLSFPNYLSVKQNYLDVFGEDAMKEKEDGTDQGNAEPLTADIDTEIDEKVIDLIDYDLRFVKFPQQFFAGDKAMTTGVKFSETVRNIKKEVLSYYRELDIQQSVLKKREHFNAKKAKVLELNKKLKQLTELEYRKAYIERMKRLIF